MFFIRVQTDSEYKFIREDRWNTPVRTPLKDSVKRFSTSEEAIEYIDSFKMLMSHWFHEIVNFDTDEIHYIYSDAPNKKGRIIKNLEKLI